MSQYEELPATPVKYEEFVEYIADAQSPAAVREKLKPFLEYESKLRSIFAQEPDHPAIKDNFAGIVPVYAGHDDKITYRARDLKNETKAEKERYIMPIAGDDEWEYGTSGARAVVPLEEFQKNFSIFSEGALHNMDW